MPSPITPSDFKQLVADAGADFCAKFLGLLDLPRKFYEWFSWFYNDDGTISDEVLAELCEGCTGDSEDDGGVPGSGGTGLDAPTNVQASDGAYNDKVRVTWAGVTGATSYEVWRNTINDHTSASLVGTSGSTSYDDMTATPGTQYYYWVRAKSADEDSNLSTPDAGYASAVAATPTNVIATHGRFYLQSYVLIGFDKVAAATHYDIYRGTVDNFNHASTVKIASEREPYDNDREDYSCPIIPCTDPIFLDSGTHLVYYDSPPLKFQKYYYWVVAKTKSGGMVTGVSANSASADGWAQGNGTGVIPLAGLSLSVHNQEEVLTAGVTKVWIYTLAGGGGGAGAGTVNGGGGGGGGLDAWGQWAVVNPAGGDKIRMRLTPITSKPSGGGDTSNGTDAPTIIVEYWDSVALTWTTLFELVGGTGGVYAGGGGGAGGSAASVTTIHASLTSSGSKIGTAGDAAVGSEGGRAGAGHWDTRRPAGNRDGVLNNGSPHAGTAVGNAGGGGSDFNTTPLVTYGGDGSHGGVVLVTYT